MIEVLKYIEFFAEEFSRDCRSEVSLAKPGDVSDSFFKNVEEDRKQLITLTDLLNGQSCILESLSEVWRSQNFNFYEIPLHVNAFINANQEDLNSEEMKVRTILDYVYVVV